jgi:Crp-like helix-turn-helix domain
MGLRPTQGDVNGMSRETVTRTLADFRKQHIAELHGSTLRIQNAPALRELATQARRPGESSSFMSRFRKLDLINYSKAHNLRVRVHCFRLCSTATVKLRRRGTLSRLRRKLRT